MSLRTKSAREAKDRCQIAFNRLAAYWDSLRAKPVTLTPIEVKAQAGKTYRQAVKRFDSDFDFRDGIETFVEEYGATTQSFFEEGYEPQVAERLASIEMGDPRALHTCALRHGDGLMSRDEIAKGVFGEEARQLAADNQVRLDEASLARVTRELVNVGKAFGELAMRRLSSADHSDEVGQNLPGLLPVSWTPSAAQKVLVSINEPMSGSGASHPGQRAARSPVNWSGWDDVRQRRQVVVWQPPIEITALYPSGRRPPADDASSHRDHDDLIAPASHPRRIASGRLRGPGFPARS